MEANDRLLKSGKIAGGQTVATVVDKKAAAPKKEATSSSALVSDIA